MLWIVVDPLWIWMSHTRNLSSKILRCKRLVGTNMRLKALQDCPLFCLRCQGIWIRWTTPRLVKNDRVIGISCITNFGMSFLRSASWLSAVHWIVNTHTIHGTGISVYLPYMDMPWAIWFVFVGKVWSKPPFFPKGMRWRRCWYEIYEIWRISLRAPKNPHNLQAFSTSQLVGQISSIDLQPVLQQQGGTLAP